MSSLLPLLDAARQSGLLRCIVVLWAFNEIVLQKKHIAPQQHG